MQLTQYSISLARLSSSWTSSRVENVSISSECPRIDSARAESDDVFKRVVCLACIVQERVKARDIPCIRIVQAPARDLVGLSCNSTLLVREKSDRTPLGRKRSSPWRYHLATSQSCHLPPSLLKYLPNVAWDTSLGKQFSSSGKENRDDA